jgi:hypothetical protein
MRTINSKNDWQDVFVMFAFTKELPQAINKIKRIQKMSSAFLAFGEKAFFSLSPPPKKIKMRPTFTP